MKELADGHKVTSRSYYYLLDFNDRDNFKYLNGCIKKNKLCDCVKAEYKKLFKYATEKDFKNI